MTANEIQKCRKFRDTAIAAGRVSAEQFNRMVKIIHVEGWYGEPMTWHAAAMVAANISTAHLRCGLACTPEIMRRVGVA